MLGPFIVKVIYIYLIGFALAVLEIQIEGKGGWASTLPTWRPHPESKIGRAAFKITKKELTGYHAVLFPLVMFLFHLPFIWFWTWSWQGELEVLAFYFIFAVFWDFLWFVLNPHYSLHTFNRENVWWHRAWLGRVPVDYIVGLLLSIGLFIPLILSDPANLLKLIILIFGIILLTIVTVLIYPKAY